MTQAEQRLCVPSSPAAGIQERAQCHFGVREFGADAERDQSAIRSRGRGAPGASPSNRIRGVRASHTVSRA